MRKTLALFLASSMTAPPLVAQSPAARDTLAAAVVTATRTGTATLVPLSAGTVLPGAALRARGLTDLADALRDLPGVMLVGGSSRGAQTSLFLRGGNSNAVRVLVDGVAINDAGGAIDLANLSLENVERIEVVRGPVSVLYGSDAVAGVVQVFTRDGSGPAGLSATLGGGTHGALLANVGVSGGGAGGGFSLAAGRGATDGVLAFNNRYVTDALTGSARIVAGDRTTARLAARWTSADYHYPTDYDGSIADRNAQQVEHRLVASADVAHQLTDAATLHAVLTSNEHLPRSNDGADSPADTLGFYGFFSRSTRTRRAADLRADVRAGRATWTAGVEFARERERSTSLSLSQYGPDAGAFEAARHNTGSYGQVVGDAGDRWSYLVGVRHDENSAFGAFTTGRAALGAVLAPGMRARVSAGTAFKAPSFFENFSAGYVVGNASLRPERARSAEVGLTASTADGVFSADLSAFVQRFRDLVQYSPKPARAGGPNYFNVAGADADGTELTLTWHPTGATTLGATWTWLATRVTDAGFDSTAGATYVRGARLLRRPTHTLALRAHQALGTSGTLDLVATRIGERDDRDFAAYPVAPVVLPAYTRVDLSATMPIGAGLSALVRVDNLLDARYDEIARFRAPGRLAFVGLQVARVPLR